MFKQVCRCSGCDEAAIEGLKLPHLFLFVRPCFTNHAVYSIGTVISAPDIQAPASLHPFQVLPFTSLLRLFRHLPLHFACFFVCLTISLSIFHSDTSLSLYLPSIYPCIYLTLALSQLVSHILVYL